MIRTRHLLIILAAALAAMAPKCSSKDCQMLRENAERICASGSPRACEAAQQALALCPAPEPSPTPTATPSPEPTPEPTPTPLPTPTPPGPLPTPTPTPPAPEPTPTPEPGCEDKPAASSAGVTIETHGDAGLVFTIHPKGGAFGAARWSDLTYPSVTSWFAPPDAKGGIDCQEPKAECHGVLLYMGKDAKNPNLKKNQGGFTVTGESGSVFRIHYSGLRLDSVETLKVGPGVPCPPPTLPTPPPSGPGASVNWKQTEVDGPDHCPEGGVSLYSADVSAVLEDRFGPVGGTWGADETALYQYLAPFFRARGLDVAIYGEELAVAKYDGKSEQFDLLATGGAIRRPPGAYRSACFPATRSQALPVAAPPPSSTTWPQHVDQIRAKLHVPSSMRNDGNAVLDSVGLWNCKGLPACTLPNGFVREFIPSCGSEAAEGDTAEQQRIVKCAADLAEEIGLRWEGPGRENPSNAWLWLCPAGSKARACAANGLCSAWVEAK